MAGEKKLSIAHVMLSQGYGSNERQVELLIKELAVTGVTQLLICRDDSPLPYHMDGVPNLSFIRMTGSSDPFLVAHFKLSKRFSMIHAHDNNGMQWALVHYLMFGIPYIITVRDENIGQSGILNHAVYNNASYLVAVSKTSQDLLAKNFKREVQVIPDCVSRLRPNMELVNNFRQSLKNRFVIGHIGPMVDKQKGQSTIIAAAKALNTRIPELIVVFVGDGPDRNKLRAAANGMPNIKFVGNKRNYIDYIAAFDAFVYPSYVEGQAGVLLDVLDIGVPTIASNIPCISNLIQHGQSGILIKPGDSNALAEWILCFKRDISLCRMLSAGGREVVKQFSSNTMAAAYYHLYFKVLN